jgi:uncharacterized CHY-type Zn-finger protein
MEILVHGKTVDDQTRCVHYSGPTDIIAIKFNCCRVYYPCFQCHRECADHESRQWPADEWDEKAILCGVCRSELSVRTYLGTLSCPHCSAEFNEGCRLHRHLYFQAAATRPVADNNPTDATASS